MATTSMEVGNNPLTIPETVKLYQIKMIKVKCYKREEKYFIEQVLFQIMI